MRLSIRYTLIAIPLIVVALVVVSKCSTEERKAYAQDAAPAPSTPAEKLYKIMLNSPSSGVYVYWGTHPHMVTHDVLEFDDYETGKERDISGSFTVEEQ